MERIQNGLAVRTFVGCDRPDDAVERANTQGIVVGDREPLMSRRLGLQNNVAAFLVHLPVALIKSDACFPPGRI